MAINPVSKEIDRYFSDSHLFYSRRLGKHTLIPNGTVQIFSPEEGRVIEVTWDGDLVFEFNNVVNDDINAHVINSIWLPDNFFSALPSCHEQ